MWNDRLRVSFWALLIGSLLLVFGITSLANDVFHMNINIPWFPLILIIIAIWILSHALKKL
jgi:hypothetical protein